MGGSGVIEKLAYVRRGVADLGRAAAFAEDIVGLQRVEAGEGVALFRSDARDPSLALVEGEAGASLGLELRDMGAMEALEQRLAGRETWRGSEAECAARRGCGRSPRNWRFSMGFCYRFTYWHSPLVSGRKSICFSSPSREKSP